MLDERLPSSDLCSTTPDDLAEGTQETTAAGEPRSTTNVLAELAQLTVRSLSKAPHLSCAVTSRHGVCFSTRGASQTRNSALCSLVRA